MNVRRVSTALAAACLCVSASPAWAQVDPAGPADKLGPAARVRAAEPPADQSFRISPAEPAGRRSSPMIRSWTVDTNAEFGFGRFVVPNTARPRTHTDRLGSGMELETRRIAGAGLHVRF